MSNVWKVALLIIAGVIIDQVTKWWMFASPELVQSVSWLQLVQNTGISRGWGLPMWFIILVSIGALGGFVRWWRVDRSLSQWVFVLLMAGTIGNLIDRAYLGYVRDFVEFGRWFVFNIADVYLTVAVWVLIIQELRTLVCKKHVAKRT